MVRSAVRANIERDYGVSEPYPDRFAGTGGDDLATILTQLPPDVLLALYEQAQVGAP